MVMGGREEVMFVVCKERISTWLRLLLSWGGQEFK